MAAGHPGKTVGTRQNSAGRDMIEDLDCPCRLRLTLSCFALKPLISQSIGKNL
jgi:hypothetical protein